MASGSVCFFSADAWDECALRCSRVDMIILAKKVKEMEAQNCTINSSLLVQRGSHPLPADPACKEDNQVSTSCMSRLERASAAGTRSRALGRGKLLPAAGQLTMVAIHAYSA